jgi:branched-chain amino acid transport system ATP-binding protein
MNDSMPALEVRGLTAGYDRTVVLRDVTLTVRAGTVTALLGPNGAGKTTLLRAVSGTLPARGGEILLHGRDITHSRPHERSRAGLCHVPEGRGIFRSLTVRENLCIQARPRQEKQAIDRAVGVFPILGERLRQRAGTLSGGQQQMLAMAASYSRDSSMVLVDEASLGLAPVVVDEIFGFLGRRAVEGASVLLVDQYATRALKMASAAYVLRKGEIVYDGAAATLLDADVFAHYTGAAELA